MSAKPQRVKLSRAKGWRMPAGAVKVDRSTVWGNPYVIVRQGSKWVVSWGGRGAAGKAFFSLREAQGHAVERYREYVTGEDPGIEDLRGKDLACWCRLGDPCHADVLLELANGQGELPRPA